MIKPNKREVERDRTVDWQGFIKNSVEKSYPNGIVHGLQKDAIQNGFDGRLKKRGPQQLKEWSMVFELVEKIKKFPRLLTITDVGTSGMTGKLTSDDVTEEMLKTGLSEEECWARWEAMAYEKTPGPGDTLGSKGIGKFILIAASENYEIYYDSLRKDGTYRMGHTKAGRTKCPLYSLEEEDGRKKIKEKTGRDPLAVQGTRIIIVDPIPDVRHQVENGELIHSIEETWWPIITKFKAKIFVKNEKKTLEARTLSLYDFIEKKETDEFKKHILNDHKFTFEGESYRIKHLHIAYDEKTDVPERLTGVAVFRGGMKITSIPFSETRLGSSVFGYVEFEKNVDLKLYEQEDISHYNFENKKIWRKIKLTINDELQAFANKKLGLGINSKQIKQERQKNIENKVLGIIGKLTQNWFTQSGSGPRPPSPRLGPNPSQPKRKLGITVSGINFPDNNGINRLNYGESLEGFYATIYNQTSASHNLKFRSFVLSGDREILKIDDKTFSVDAKTEQKTSKGYKIIVTPKLFPDPGKYKIKFRLADADTAKEYQTITRDIWVEMDPVLKGPFDIKAIDLSEEEELATMEWIINPLGDDKYELIYNTGHPTYLVYETEDDELMMYITELCLWGAIYLAVKNYESIDEEKRKRLPFNSKDLLSDDSATVFQEISRVFQAKRFEINQQQ